jgi:hypothetical protein
MDSEDIVRKFHQKRARIRDPEKIHPGSGSRIQGIKKHRIPDPDPQHWVPEFCDVPDYPVYPDPTSLRVVKKVVEVKHFLINKMPC